MRPSEMNHHVDSEFGRFCIPGSGFRKTMHMITDPFESRSGGGSRIADWIARARDLAIFNNERFSQRNPPLPGCAVQIGKFIRANPSPEGRGSGEGYNRYLFNAFSFLYPSPAAHQEMGGTLSLRERDSQIHASDSENHTNQHSTVSPH